MKTYETLAAELVKQLGYDAMAQEILDRKQTALRTFKFLRAIPAFKFMQPERQMIIKTALCALEKEQVA